MNYKGTWESICSTFYTTNFSLLITALIVSDSGFFKIIPDILNCIFETKPFENWLFLFLFTFCILGLLVYFIIDWLDANLVTAIDNDITQKDIILWITAPITTSIVIAILVSRAWNFSLWLVGGFLLYLIVNGLILIKRDSRIENAEGLQWMKNRKNYNIIQKIKIWQNILGWLYIIVFCTLFVFVIFNLAYFKELTFLSLCYLLLYGGFFIIISVNITLKYCRHKFVMVAVYENVSGENR